MFKTARVVKIYFNDNKHNSLHLPRKSINNSLIWCENKLGYLSADIICSQKRTVFREENLTVSFEPEQIMFKDKYPSTPLKSNEGYCVHYLSNIFRNTRSFENWGLFSDIPQFKLENIRKQSASQPDRQPVNQPTNQPDSQPVNQPTNQPDSQPPTSQPASEPLLLPPTHPLTNTQRSYLWNQAVSY